MVLGLLPIAAGGPLAADELARPTGAVVLTLAGEVGATNRPPFDAFDDAFFNYMEKDFAKAAAFDVAMLESLGMQEATIVYDAWPHPVTIEGPRLADLLAAAGAAGRDVTVVALDGYAVEISAEEVARLPWIVGVKANGAYFGLGGRGPTWVIYAPPDGTDATVDDETRWVWSVLLIEVR